MTVPSGALQRGPAGYYTYVVKPDGIVDMRNVEVNQIAGGIAVVDAGVSAGEQVVTAGQYRLQPGVRVAATSDGASR